MKPPTIYRRTALGLVPASVWAQEQFDKIKLGAEVTCDIRRTRRTGHHRKFWALLTIIASNHDGIDTPEQALEVLCACLGRGKWIEITGASKPLFVRDSIAYASMDQEEFDRFYSDCVNATIRHLVPVERDDLLDEIARF